MSGSTPFQRLLEADQLLEVGVDDLKIWLPSSQKRGIGTRALNGCTCVVLLGKEAILMAHVSPIPGKYQQWVKNPDRNISQASIEHHDNWLTKATERVKEHADQFPATTTAWGIFAVSSDGSFIKTVYHQVQEQLGKMGFSMKPGFYKEVPPSAVYPPKGEAVAFFRNGAAELYLEDRRLWPQAESPVHPVEALPSSRPIQSTDRTQHTSSSGRGEYLHSSQSTGSVRSNTVTAGPSTLQIASRANPNVATERIVGASDGRLSEKAARDLGEQNYRLFQKDNKAYMYCKLNDKHVGIWIEEVGGRLRVYLPSTGWCPAQLKDDGYVWALVPESPKWQEIRLEEA